MVVNEKVKFLPPDKGGMGALLHCFRALETLLICKKQNNFIMEIMKKILLL
jgi:hypothetical protein